MLTDLTVTDIKCLAVPAIICLGIDTYNCKAATYCIKFSDESWNSELRAPFNLNMLNIYLDDDVAQISPVVDWVLGCAR